MSTPRKSFALPLLLAGIVAGCGGRDATPAPADPAASDQAALDRSAAPIPAAPAAPATPAADAPTPQVMEGIPSRIALPPKGTETPVIAPGAEVTYVCESGMSLRVAFDGVRALVAWTDGRRMTLSRTAGDGGAGERYAGDGFTLRRVANVVELAQDGGGQQWRCAEGSATA